ncbi:DUF1385 domain-containing protein [Calderihabitans maritimus]|uniref:Membrane protein n=1 Tax=Calderihabitans maritimus TaxID=1246530 RepID=A0A1Z5HWC2_9FIRM|nr:DUF1385 domain-containing protein [Calderihabitans maritimus]GAW93814.1 membrane protein [Calderihabitans maritimus]
MPNIHYGGQAVIEGVMMRGPNEMAVAVRKNTGEIVVERETINSLANRIPIFKWPLLRGFLALMEALVIGIKALTFSANQVAEEKEQLSTLEIIITIILALGAALLLFVVLPTSLAHGLRAYMSEFWLNLVEGILRIAIFLGYIVAISQMKDIQRIFAYHGAEHKVIGAFEAGEELTIDNAQKFSTLHPRCGTNFLLIVMLLTILVFSFLSYSNLLWRVLSRIFLMPLIAGAAYEIIKLAGRYPNSKLVHTLIAPGLWLQKLTTREPDDEQVEVALEALKALIPEGKEDSTDG